MVKALVLLTLSFAANALRFSDPVALKDKALETSEKPTALKDKSENTYEMEYEMACTVDARKAARKHIEAKDWDAVKKNVCVRGYADQVDRLESGLADVEDIGEWLDGDLKAPAELRAQKTEQAESDANKPMCQNLPSLLYIGMGHSGSTTLSMQMNAHPELSYGQVKEHSFTFLKGETPAVEKAIQAGDDTKIPLVSKERNIQLYKQAFNVPCQKKTFDATIGYIFRPGGNVKLIKETLGNNTKILVMLRDPSRWMNSLEKDHAPGLKWGHNGCYADFLQTWMHHFPKENFLIESSEEYFKDPQSTLDRISDHVGIQRHKYPEVAFHRVAGRRRSGSWPQAKIAEYKADPKNVKCAVRLQQLAGRKFAWAEEMIQASKDGTRLEK